MIIFNEEKYNKLRSMVPIFVEHNKGIVTFNKLEKEFITDETKEKYIDSIKINDLDYVDLIEKKLSFLSKLTLEKITDKTIQKNNELQQF